MRKTLRPKLGEALLASDTPDVRRGASPATRIGERLVARKLLGAGQDKETLTVLLRLYRLLDV